MLAHVYHVLNRHPVGAGWLGMASTAVATGVSFMPQIDFAIRFATSLIGLVIGVLTLCITWRKWREKSKDQ